MRKIFSALLFFAVFLIWRALQGLLEGAIYTWVDDKVAAKFNLTSPAVSTVIAWGVAIGPPVALTAMILFMYHFWHTRFREKENADAANQRAVTHNEFGGTVGLPPILSLSTGENGSYSISRAINLHARSRTLNLRVENLDRKRSVTDIEVSIRSIKPYSHRTGPWCLRKGFSLSAGADIFIPLASYGESYDVKNAPRAVQTDNFLMSNSVFELLVQSNTLSARNVPTPSKETAQYVLVRATGMGTAVCDYRCKIWVDRSDGRLRIADADGNDDYLSLYEAARRLIDEDIGIFDDAARKLSGNDPILWWCYWIEGKTQVYGKYAPARVMRAFPKNGYDLKVDGTSVAGVERYGHGRWEELSILSSEFKDVLGKARHAAGQHR